MNTPAEGVFGFAILSEAECAEVVKHIKLPLGFELPAARAAELRDYRENYEKSRTEPRIPPRIE